ncbi:alpha-glycosidase [Paenibacillus tarimensis]|uniref:alpha-glycosidase n=1 Tax=Paenibacillus tarimensis TaxID=416012 RepID=UPI001F1B8DF6|nr:alpha-glycosidase [Paenibacillus tarimensis]MCF2943179.1 alpha-glycosidase [Paenibacillus tarimensis]
MLLEAIEHRPKINWASALDKETIELRIRTKRSDMESVEVYAGDKYDWGRTKRYIPMRKLASDSLFDYWQAFAKPEYRRLRYAFALDDGRVKLWMTEQGFEPEEPADPNQFFDFPYLNPADIFTPPAWVKDAIFYQIFPERFANGDPSISPENVEEWGGEPRTDNFFGGDLQGVIDHLDYLEELGITAIYFTPVFEAPTNHKYDTRDYLKVDPHFGTNEKLKELVDRCHERGIRVLLDAVFNHAGRTFPAFVDCLEKGEASEYADWFHVREWPLDVKDGIPTYETFAFERNMPKFNTENPEVQDYLLKVARYWLEEVGIDGWRLDVANEVDHRFWRKFRDTVKEVNSDAYILGEVWHDSLMWLQGDQFDAVMNYPFTTAVLDFFVEQKLDAKGLTDAMGRLIAKFPTRVTEAAFNLLDSHDTPRLLTLCGDNKPLMKLAALVQLTFVGVPCIYYGDEVGLTGEQDPGCRKCMEWDTDKQDRELFDFYRTLIGMRRSSEALRTGSFRVLLAEPNSSVLAYSRYTEQEEFIIMVNNTNRPAALNLPVGTGVWINAWDGSTAQAPQGILGLEIEPYGFRVFKKAE